MKTWMIILILFLMGCEGIIGSPKERKIIEREEILTGTEGIAMEFSPNMLDSIRENSIYNIMFELENRGASDIKDGLITVDVEEKHLELKEEPLQRIYLKGRSFVSSIGDRSIIVLKAKTRQIFEEQETSTIALNACYTYKTEASINTCIDTDLENIKKEKACTVGGESTSGGQGGPVAVTGITPKMLPTEREDLIIPHYEIEIQNVGDGIVMDTGDAKDLCLGRIIRSEEPEKINVQAWLADQALACEKKRVREEEKQQGTMTMICTLPEGIQKIRGTYTTFMKITLDYGYVQSIEKEIEITK